MAAQLQAMAAGRLKRGNIVLPRSVSRLQAIILAVLVISFFFVLVTFDIRNFLPEVITTWQSSATNSSPDTTTDWHACNGDAACCRRILSSEKSPHRVVNAAFRRASGWGVHRWRMATHRNSDNASWNIRLWGVWQRRKTLSILSALRKAGPRSVLLDVGANIGWFTLAIANAGHHVVAVEPLEENVALLKHSLCLASLEVRNRVSVLPHAVGRNDGQLCGLWQRSRFNRGDTFTVCDESSKYAVRMRQLGFLHVGEAHLRQLDTIISTGETKFSNDTGIVVRIDIAGFEPMALNGATQFLLKFKPRIIFSNFTPKMIMAVAQTAGISAANSIKSAMNFLKFMGKVGYSNVLRYKGVKKDWGPAYEAVFIRRKRDIL